MSEQKLDALLKRTATLHEAVQTHVSDLFPVEDRRSTVAFQAGLLSLEHAIAAVALIDIELQASAYALMRPQYESLVRGIWLLYAASDNWVEKLGEPLTMEAAKRANEGPMLADMLKNLEASSTAPQFIVGQLKEFRDVTWKALNSYAHGGLHPLARTATGYPAQLTYDVVRNSNAIVAMTTQLLSVLTGDPSQMEPIRRLHVDFADCLPITSGPQQPTDR
jgi:hypothetical protein